MSWCFVDFCDVVACGFGRFLVTGRLDVHVVAGWPLVPVTGRSTGSGAGGFGALAGQATFRRKCRNRPRTRESVSRCGTMCFFQGRVGSTVRPQASRHWVCVSSSQVHRSAATVFRSCGQVQPKVCFSMRKVCSISNRRRYACHKTATVAASRSTTEFYDHTGFGIEPLGNRSTSSTDHRAFDHEQLPAW